MRAGICSSRHTLFCLKLANDCLKSTTRLLMVYLPCSQSAILPAAGLPPVAAQLQRKGSTMAAEIARAASTPSGAGGAASREHARPSGPGTVLVVPKKKQASPPLKTPKKPAGGSAAAAAVVDASATNGSHGSASEDGTPGAGAMPAAAAEAASKAVAAALRRPKGRQQGGADARSPGPAAAGEEQPQEDLEQQQQQEGSEQLRAVEVKPASGSEQIAALESAEVGSKAKSSKPPPGFEAVNGAAKAAGGRAKKVDSCLLCCQRRNFGQLLPAHTVHTLFGTPCEKSGLAHMQTYSCCV